MILGSTVLAAVHLVSEPATWLCLFITAWQHQFGGAKKKQGKKSKADAKTEGSQPDHPGQAIIKEQLVQMQQAVAQSLQGLVNALNARSKSPAKVQLANAMHAVLGDQQSALAQALTGCMSQSEARAVLDAVSAAQFVTLKQIRSQATDLLATL